MRMGIGTAAALALALGSGLSMAPVDRMVPEPTPIVRKSRPSNLNRKQWSRRRSVETRRQVIASKRFNAKRSTQSERDKYAEVVNCLTNWQRNQWARAGYPGLRNREVTDVLPFALKVRS